MEPGRAQRHTNVSHFGKQREQPMTAPTPSADAGRSRSSSSSAGATGPNARPETAGQPLVPQAEQAPPVELHNRPLEACAPLDARLPLPAHSSASVQPPSGGQAPVESAYLIHMRESIDAALRNGDAAAALEGLTREFTCRPATHEEAALMASKILGVFSLRGRENPATCLHLLHSFLASASRGILVEIHPEIAHSLIKDLVLPTARDPSLRAEAFSVCTALARCGHAGSAAVDFLVATAVGNGLASDFQLCTKLLEALPDRAQRVFFAERLLKAIEALPHPSAPMLTCAFELASLLATEGNRELAGLYLGRLLMRATASDVVLRDDSLAPTELAALFRHPDISGADKRAAGSLVAVAVHGRVQDPFRASSVVASAAHCMSRFAKITTAQRLLEIEPSTLHPRRQDRLLADRISVISELVADVEDDDEARVVREQLTLHCYLLLRLHSSQCGIVLLRAELIRLDPANALEHLYALLKRLTEPVVLALTPDELDLIAIATAQADPEGCAYIPGTEVVIKNSLSDGYIDGGVTFHYPPVLAARRAKVRDFMRASASVRNQGEIKRALVSINALAGMSQEYVGVEITPRHWPALRTHLRENP
jgi:hypothetical protein